VPDITFKPVEKLPLLPESTNFEVLLFSVMPVTLEPIAPLMSVDPVPLPELVIVPLSLTLVPERVIPLPIELLLLRIRLPVPVTLPETVRSWVPLALLLVRVVPPLLTLTAPLTFKADVVLFSVMPVTLEPTAALIDVAPLPVPELVIVPVLLTLVVERVMPLAIELLLLRTRFPVPVTPPDSVRS